MAHRITRSSTKDAKPQNSGSPASRYRVNLPNGRASSETPSETVRPNGQEDSQNERYAAARKFLTNANVLDTTAPCNPHTVANALSLLVGKCETILNWEKAIPYIAETILKIEHQCEGCMKAAELPLLMQGLKAELREDMAKVDKNVTKLTEQLGKATERLETTASEMHSRITAVSSTTSQLETTANSYKDALLKIPTQLNNPDKGYGEIDPAISRSADRKSRQVLIDFPDDQMSSFSTETIKEKILDAANKIKDPAPPNDFAIENITKLKNNGIIILFSAKDAAAWLLTMDVQMNFTAYLSSGASIRPRNHTVLVPRLPITLDPTNEAHLREIEEGNLLEPNSITKARWIKPEKRRKPDQRLAHASFSFSSAEAANICIRDGIIVQGVKSYPSGLKQEPTQCLKCRRWGHYANQCSEPKDICGTCGGEHWTNACMETTKRYCVSCKVHMHASWDRQCPEFIRKCSQFDESHPDNVLKYYLTDEPWTKVIRPPKIPFAERFPKHFAVGSLPPPNGEKQRDLPTRALGKRRKRRSLTRTTDQPKITHFYHLNASQTRSERSNEDAREASEVDELTAPLSSPDITTQSIQPYDHEEEEQFTTPSTP